MNYVNVVCSACGKEVAKEKGEHSRRVRLGKDKFYCNNKCSSVHSEALQKNIKYCKENPQEAQLKLLKSINYKKFILKQKEDNKYLILKEFLRRIKRRDKRKCVSSNLDYEYLVELWEKQKGICPYSGNIMTLQFEMTPYTASLDRIDSSLPYLKNNVEFVCVAVNYAKSTFSKEEMKKFFSREVSYVEYMI